MSPDHHTRGKDTAMQEVQSVPWSSPPWGRDAALWCTRLWLFQQRSGLKVRAAIWITELNREEGWKMHTPTAGRQKRNKGSPTMSHLSLSLTSTKEKPWEAVPRLGCDPVRAQMLLLSTAGCFWPLWWKQSECTLLQVYEIRLNNTFKSFTHAKKSHTCLLSKDNLWIY